MNKKDIFVTKPSMPPLEEFIPYLENIWKEHVLTNNGRYHRQLEKELCEFLGVKYLSLFCNGTIALLTAIQALKISGEVITTPFSFVATSHTLLWNNITPVFIDIDPFTFNLNQSKIEEAITDKTSAIMPVHVYGNPCDVESIKKIAEKYKMKVIYDAAHAFGVEKDEISILNYGDLSVLSFHATKTYNTFEGGAIVCHDEQTKDRIDKLKNFGFAGETKVIESGINGKMNEIQAAFGLLYLKYVEEYINQRKKIAEIYRSALKDIEGITFLHDFAGVKHNYSYFPILIDETKYGKSRDRLYELFKENNIYCRRYFYPLITDFPIYNNGILKNTIPIAQKISSQVLCLPIYPDLSESDIKIILSCIHKR